MAMDLIAALRPRSRRDANLLSLARSHWPLIISLAMFLLATVALITYSVSRNDGHFVYALDDPYIHLAIADNLVNHGIWGVTDEAFTSSASSLTWPLLLGLFVLVFGTNEIAPLVLNLAVATLLLTLIYSFLTRYRFPRWYVGIVLLTVVFFTPLTTLAFAGMEHTLHVFLAVVFIYLATRDLTTPQRDSSRTLLLLTALMLVATRYEGMFMVAIVAALYLFRRRPSDAALVTVAGALPIAIYGIISVSNGWGWLPASLQLKSTVIDLHSLSGIVHAFGYRGLDSLATEPHLLVLVLATAIVFHFSYRQRRSIWRGHLIAILIFMFAVVMHLQFARIGSFYRYEAYLVVVGLLVLAVTAYPHLVDWYRQNVKKGQRNTVGLLAGIVVIAVILSPIVTRGLEANSRIPRASANIYGQQYQMALFVNEYYRLERVAINDIGTTSYFVSGRILDVFGLGTREVAEAKQNGSYDQQVVAEFVAAKDARVAIVYEQWFEDGTVVAGGVPSNWIKVGEWELANNVIAGSDVVSFYAFDSATANELSMNLRDFSHRLPSNVTESGDYTQLALGVHDRSPVE